MKPDVAVANGRSGASKRLPQEAQTVRYTNGRGLGIWNGDTLEIETETDRQFTSVPAGLPDWWDAPGSCSGDFTLVPHHLHD